MRAMDSRLWAFVVVATLLAVTPGADTLLVVRNVLNPKVGIFYLAFLPQFVGPGDPVLERSLLLAALHIGIGVVWLSVLTLGVGRIRPLVESRLWRARLEGVSGAVLIGLGVRLAAARR